MNKKIRFLLFLVIMDYKTPVAFSASVLSIAVE